MCISLFLFPSILTQHPHFAASPPIFFFFFSLSKTQVGLCLPLLVSTMREQCQEKGKVEEREDKKTQVERHGVCLAGHLAEDESKLVEFCGNC